MGGPPAPDTAAAKPRGRDAERRPRTATDGLARTISNSSEPHAGSDPQVSNGTPGDLYPGAIPR
jgi:hypothetical protein